MANIRAEETFPQDLLVEQREQEQVVSRNKYMVAECFKRYGTLSFIGIICEILFLVFLLGIGLSFMFFGFEKTFNIGVVSVLTIYFVFVMVISTLMLIERRRFKNINKYFKVAWGHEKKAIASSAASSLIDSVSDSAISDVLSLIFSIISLKHYYQNYIYIAVGYNKELGDANLKTFNERTFSIGFLLNTLLSLAWIITITIYQVVTYYNMENYYNIKITNTEVARVTGIACLISASFLLGCFLIDYFLGKRIYIRSGNEYSKYIRKAKVE